MDEMGKDTKALLKWMLDVVEARNTNPRERTIDLKFTKATMTMWQNRAREALAFQEVAEEFPDQSSECRCRESGTSLLCPLHRIFLFKPQQ